MHMIIIYRNNGINIPQLRNISINILWQYTPKKTLSAKKPYPIRGRSRTFSHTNVYIFPRPESESKLPSKSKNKVREFIPISDK